MVLLSAMMSIKPKPSLNVSPRTGGAKISPANTSILIVDDSATMRSVLRSMLTRLGYQNLDEAEDGAAALTLIRAHSYALIISDWHMEPMNGLDLLREVRRQSRPGANRFIFSTTERSWGSQTSAKSDGAEGFLVKPFTLQALQGKVEAALRI